MLQMVARFQGVSTATSLATVLRSAQKCLCVMSGDHETSGCPFIIYSGNVQLHDAGQATASFAETLQHQPNQALVHNPEQQKALAFVCAEKRKKTKIAEEEKKKKDQLEQIEHDQKKQA